MSFTYANNSSSSRDFNVCCRFKSSKLTQSAKMYLRAARALLGKDKSFKCVTNHSFRIDKFSNERLYSSAATDHKEYYNENDVEAFKATKPQFVNEVMSFIHKYDREVGADWFAKALDYNLMEKRPYRGILTISAYKALANDSQLKPEDLELVRFVTWCSKLQEAAVTCTDDVTDETAERFGAPTWHCLPEVRNQFVNDYILFASIVYPLLEMRIGTEDFYPAVVKTFREHEIKAYLGQTTDYVLTQQSIAKHTEKMYLHSTNLKTCGYGCFQPFELALNLTRNKDPQLHKDIAKICAQIGLYWTMRNEFLDCNNGSVDVGRTDIKVSKVTWLSLKALEVANKDQFKILIDCYGTPDPEKEERVKSLFLEMGIDKMWVEAENEYYNSIHKMIDNLKNDNIKPVLYTFCENVRTLC